jgi:glycerol-3-phosphate O-acyltransferase
VQAKKGDKSILMLTYYRNNLIHHFINESFIACTLLGFSNIHDIGKGVNINDIWPRLSYLKTMLQNEFIYRKTIETKDDMITTVRFLAQRGFLNYDESTQLVSLDSKNENSQYS